MSDSLERRFRRHTIDEPANNATEELGDAYCAICNEPAIHPFRCAKLDEILDPNAVIDHNIECTERYHICCYQCLGKNMLKSGTDRFDCPGADGNVFVLNRLIAAQNIIRGIKNHQFFCKNNCGLIGSPLALADHICPIRGECERLTEEMTKIRAELRHVLQNYGLRKEYALDLKTKYRAISVDYAELQKQHAQLEGAYDNFGVLYDMLDDDMKRMVSQDKQFQVNYQLLQRDYDQLQSAFEKLQLDHDLTVEDLNKVVVDKETQTSI